MQSFYSRRAKAQGIPGGRCGAVVHTQRYAPLFAARKKAQAKKEKAEKRQPKRRQPKKTQSGD